MPPGQVEIREGYAEVGEQRVHYVEACEGPLVLLLHGFPEFWFGWRRQIDPLAAADFRVVAPSWVEAGYPNVIYLHEVDQGGHFAAWEEPELFSSELRGAFSSLR